MVDPKLERALNFAVELAQIQKCEFVSLEHVLLALIQKDPDTIEILEGCGLKIDKLKPSLEEFIQKNCPKVDLTDSQNPQTWRPELTLAFHRLLQRAAIQVQASGKKLVKGGNLLVSLFSEKDSHALYYLTEQGISQFDLIQYMSHGRSHLPVVKNPKESQTSIDGLPSPEDGEQKKSALELYCTNLNEKARLGKTDPLVGRENVLERVVQVLARRTKNNPLLIGEAGVGKTAIADGLAQRIIENKVPKRLAESTIYSLDMGALLAGTKYRGDFEERIKLVVDELKEQKNSIVFIDEIHTLVGAGGTTGGAMDASNLLKPSLTDGSLSCIGSTTYKEYKNHFEKDRALARRFQKIEVSEPTIEEAIEILKGLKPQYEKHHKVKYTDESIRSAVELSSKYIHDRHLPDKAIDVIDEVGAALRIRAKNDTKIVINVSDIEKVISAMAQVPAESVSHNEKDQLKNLDTKIKEKVFGQNSAIEKLVSSFKVARTGLARDNKPIGSYLFAGPTGVGKTEVAKQLAETLGLPFLRFDMSEYMEKHTVSRLVGAPPGYVGFEEGGLLTDAVSKKPYSVVLMDEIEKAHPDLINILLQVMDNGKLTDSNGRVSDFRNVTLILTSNAGAFESSKSNIGIGQTTSSSKSLDSIKKQFKPEFLNRLDAVVEFKSLEKAILLQVIHKFIGELSLQLEKKKIQLDVDDEVLEWLFEKGHDPAYGARPFARVVDEHIKRELVDDILFGKLQDGGHVKVTVKAEKLNFEIN